MRVSVAWASKEEDFLRTHSFLHTGDTNVAIPLGLERLVWGGDPLPHTGPDSQVPL